MKYIWIASFIVMLGCGENKTQPNNANSVKVVDSTETVSSKESVFTNRFIDNYFFSCNATSGNIYADTLFSLEIDTFLQKIQEDPETHNSSTMGEMMNYYEATHRLDTLIEWTYQEVYKKIETKEDKELFKESQDSWRTYYTKETKFVHEIFWTHNSSYGFGTEHNIVQAQWAFQLARQRLIFLKNINEQLGDN